MRYYVVVEAESGKSIIAEVLRETFDDGRYRDSSLAASIAGPDASIVTDAELRAGAEGAAALEAWQFGHDARAERWVEDDSVEPQLWLVRSDDGALNDRMDTWESLQARALDARERSARLRAEIRRLREVFATSVEDINERRGQGVTTP